MMSESELADSFEIIGGSFSAQRGLFSDLKVGLGTSPGLRRVLASILVGILVGNVTRGSGSPAKTDR